MEARRLFSRRIAETARYLVDGAVALGSLTVTTDLAVGDDLAVAGDTNMGPTSVNGTVSITGSGCLEIEIDGSNPRIRGRVDTDTGLGITAANVLSLFTGGAARGVLQSATADFSGAAQVVVPAGAVGAPAVAPTGDLDTGLYFPGANQAALATNGAARAVIQAATADFSGATQVVIAAGAVGAPSLAPTGDLNTGIYFPAADQVATAAGGALGLRTQQTSLFANTQLQLNSTFIGANAVWADTPHTAQNITNAGQAVSSLFRVVQLTSDANYTLTATPTLANGTLNGQLVEIINVGTFNLTFQDEGTLAGSNLQLGAATRVVAPRCSLLLRYNTTLADWIEVAFSNVP